jgi:tetratricopeptide (TPR) repeat protein
MDLVEKIKILQNYLSIGKFKKVIEGCIVLNKKFPENSFISNLSGMAYQGLGQHIRAISFFRDSLRIDNNNIAAMNNLANSLKTLGKLDLSKEIYEKILKINPSYINGLNNFANLKILWNDYDGAIELYSKAIVIAKQKKINHTNILFSLAGALHSTNKKDESIKILNEILDMDNNHTQSHKTLSSIYKYSKNNIKTIKHLEIMRNVSANHNLSDEQKIDMFFAIGKAHDDLKDINNAFNYFEKGNNLKHKISISNLADEIRIMQNIKKVFQSINTKISHNNASKKKILFICGMPRSGTTLVEQIIASHKKVYGAGELTYLTNNINEEFFENEKIKKNKIIDSQNNIINNLNKKYFDNLELHKFSENVITDKAPQNFKWIGFIKMFFPNSKIIHCNRDPEDNCLSIYKNFFPAKEMNWCYNQNDIATYYKNYKELMSFWQTKIPEFIYNINYEKLVYDKNNEINKLLNFCELETDENCFNHHKNNKTPIKTVSISQAREEIYSSSIDVSGRYKNFLGEMFDNLA